MKVTIYHRRRFHSETSRIAELEGRLAIVDNAVNTLTGRSGNIIFDERTAPRYSADLPMKWTRLAAS